MSPGRTASMRVSSAVYKPRIGRHLRPWGRPGSSHPVRTFHQLRQFVQLEAAQDPPHARDPRGRLRAVELTPFDASAHGAWCGTSACGI